MYYAWNMIDMIPKQGMHWQMDHTSSENQDDQERTGLTLYTKT